MTMLICRRRCRFPLRMREQSSIAAVPRPVTPVYSELSGILQVQLHRALTEQVEPRAALALAAAEMRAVLARAGLDEEGRP